MHSIKLRPVQFALTVLLSVSGALGAKHGHKHPKVPKLDEATGDFFKHDMKKMDPCENLDINVGLALDTSGSIDGTEYTMLTNAAADFVTSSSGFPPANNNLYYITFWDDAVRERSGIATNAGNAQNQFIFKRRENFGNTNIAAALRDQEAAWAGPPLRSGPIVVLVTDGMATSERSGTQPAANSLKGSPVGATLITIGVGLDDVGDALLRTIASPGDGPDGKLFFPVDDFGDLDIEQLVCCSIDSDGDGTVDCEDMCPQDKNKTDPGFCGCGEKDTFPCRCDLHEKGCKKGKWL